MLSAKAVAISLPSSPGGRTCVPGIDGNSGFRHDPAGYYLAAHIDYDLGGRSDENETGFRALLRKSRVFGKKTVAGVYRFSLAALRRLYDALDIEVVSPGAASDTNGFIGAHDVHRRLVCLFVDGHSLYSKLLGGAHYADGDLAPVCNQQLFEHLLARFRKEVYLSGPSGSGTSSIS